MEPNIRTCRMGLTEKSKTSQSQQPNGLDKNACYRLHANRKSIYIYVYVYMMATRPMYIDHEASAGENPRGSTWPNIWLEAMQKKNRASRTLFLSKLGTGVHGVWHEHFGWSMLWLRENDCEHDGLHRNEAVSA